MVSTSDPTPRGPDARRVARVIRHPHPMSFRALLSEVLPDGVQYLVLDLDRTVHLGINTGELLGWELNAYQSYGADRWRELEAQRGHARMYLDWANPKRAARYFARGLQQWALPGLYYLLWGKMPLRMPWLHRIAVQRHGPDTMRHAQRRTQLTLMGLIAQTDPALVGQLAEAVWQRHRPLQVVTAQDLAWARSRYAGLQVVIASASPEPTVAVAARHLGVDTYTCSTLQRINSGADKVDRLRELLPAMFAPDAIRVGITDTQYGEDHCWADHFTVVADINSQWPFPPQVARDSPLREIHSAQVLTQQELARRADGESGYRHPLRPPWLIRGMPRRPLTDTEHQAR